MFELDFLFYHLWINNLKDSYVKLEFRLNNKSVADQSSIITKKKQKTLFRTSEKKGKNRDKYIKTLQMCQTFLKN